MYEWILVKFAYSTPYALSNALSINASAFVVEDPADSILSFMESVLSFIPETMKLSISSSGNVVRTTLFAPESMCFCSESLCKYLPVASMTQSTSKTSQGTSPGSMPFIILVFPFSDIK